MKKASLTIIGCGIKFLSHLTTEAKNYIEQSEKLYYLVNDPLMKEWIVKTNPKAESLDFLYTKYILRINCYKAITDYILEFVRSGHQVCVVFYGHPTVFAKPGLDAVIQAKIEGYQAVALPGVSAEDCLFADLLINPGSYGCQSYEATYFLIHQCEFNVSSYLILWQIGTIGLLERPNPAGHNNIKGARAITSFLMQKYPANHLVTIYEAAQYPSLKPIINKLELINLPTAQFSSLLLAVPQIRA
jgi:tetrapyrrole methylase family protein/MazG family protein